VLSGFLVPKDTMVMRVGHHTSNDPANFDRPAEFLPERWLRGCPEKHNANAFANIPWGHGAR
jgi:cytochrome P450